MKIRQIVWRLVLAVSALLLTGALPIQPYSGVMMTVTTTVDEIATNGNCSLREAILAANTNRAVDRCPAGSDWDIIRLGAGVYAFAIAGIDEDDSRTGDLDVRANIKIVGAGVDKTIIDGQDLDRVLHIVSPAASVAISGLTIQNGNLHGFYIDGPQKFNPGGGIYNLGKLTLTNVRVYSNMINSGPVDTEEGGYSDGGGIYNAGTLIATDTRIDENATDLEGGGVTSPGRISLTRVIIENNSGYYSSGLHIGDAAGNVIRDSRISRNGVAELWGDGASGIALSGAGELLIERTEIRNQFGNAIKSDGKLTMRQVKVVNSNGVAETVMMTFNGPTTVTDSMFLDNDQVVVMEVGETGVVRIERSTFGNPTGTFSLDEEKRSAIHVRGQLAMYNSTITGMIGQQTILMEYGNLLLESVTIAENSVKERGLVVAGGKLTMHNTILANSRDAVTGALVPDCLVAPDSTTSLGYNILGNVDGCGWPIQPTDQHAVNNAHIDPLLGPLRENGGRTLTMALQPGSPAYNRGDPNVYLRTDQRGVTRPQGTGSDIGAYEVRVK
jgi:CSLREA domain-containing protein